MAKYHVNPETGSPGLCTATKQCRFGDVAPEHYNSKEEAASAYEASQSANTFKPVKKQVEKPKTTGERIDQEKASEGERYLSSEGQLWEVSSNHVNYRKERELMVRKVEEDGSLGQLARVSQFNGGRAVMALTLEKVDESELDVAKRNLKNAENSPGRTQSGFPEDEMIRANVEEKITGLRKKVKELEDSEPPRSKKLEDELKALENNPARKHYGFPEDEQTRYNIDQKIAKLTKDLKAQRVSEGLPAELPNNPIVHKNPGVPKSKPFENNKTYKYSNIVLAEIQVKLNDNTPAKADDYEMRRVVVPNVSRLTDKKRVEIGEELWKVSGQDMDKWENASPQAKINFSNQHIGRYGFAKIESKDSDILIDLNGGSRQMSISSPEKITLLDSSKK